MSAEQPVFYGLFRGQVVSSADPTGKKRLQVRVPQLNGRGVFPWALPCAQARSVLVEGEKLPVQLELPKNGDPVWVMFENGDPAKPVWLGSWIGV